MEALVCSQMILHHHYTEKQSKTETGRKIKIEIVFHNQWSKCSPFTTRALQIASLEKQQYVGTIEHRKVFCGTTNICTLTRREIESLGLWLLL